MPSSPDEKLKSGSDSQQKLLKNAMHNTEIALFFFLKDDCRYCMEYRFVSWSRPFVNIMIQT